MWFPSLLHSRSTREKLAVGSGERLRSRKPSLTMAALTVAAVLWNPSSVQADPIFSVNLDAGVLGGGNIFHVVLSDSAPLDQSAVGRVPPDISAGARAFAGLGPLGVGINLQNTGPQFIGPFVHGSASANFHDSFSAFLPGQRGKAGTLTFTLKLDGALSAQGEDLATNNSRADVSADFLVIDQVPSLFFDSNTRIDHFTQRVDAPDPTKLVSTEFILRAPVLLGIDNEIQISSALAVSAFAISAEPQGSFAEADFMNTFSITALQLFDAQGQFLENVSLTDSLGNTLQVGPLAAVPEPSTLTLLGLGTLGLLGYSWRRRKRAVGTMRRAVSR
jgi:hypothetical protein